MKVSFVHLKSAAKSTSYKTYPYLQIDESTLNLIFKNKFTKKVKSCKSKS